jgi:very-short-patch-repair endonuclease
VVPEKGQSPRSRETRDVRLRFVRELGDVQGGVVSRDQLRRAGITAHELAAHLRGSRWRAVHSQSVAVHTGPLAPCGHHWAAVFEAGERGCLDGASALVAGGLQHYREEVVRVSVPRGVLVRRATGIDIRQTRRLEPGDLAPGGVPRTRPEVAGVRAGLWARTDKQATLLLTMAVQQRLTTAERLGAQLLTVKRDRRRILLTSVVTDLLGGVRSLGEHEFAQMCRSRGLPEPSRQVVRQGPHGRWYLDVCWEPWDVVVEIDGIQHEWASNLVADALRHNAVTLDRAIVLRLPLLGLRVAPDEFFAQIATALVSRGCPVDLTS